VAASLCAQRRGGVRGSGRSVRIRPWAQQTLDAISFKIAPEKMVALAGAFRKGKTHARQLCAKFLDLPKRWAVLATACRFRSTACHDLRDKWRWGDHGRGAFQRTGLAANVAYGQDADRDRVMAALAAANSPMSFRGHARGVDTRWVGNACWLFGRATAGGWLLLGDLQGRAILISTKEVRARFRGPTACAGSPET